MHQVKHLVGEIDDLGRSYREETSYRDEIIVFIGGNHIIGLKLLQLVMNYGKTLMIF